MKESKKTTYRRDIRRPISVRIKPDTLAHIQQVAMEDERPYTTLISLICDHWVAADKKRREHAHDG